MMKAARYLQRVLKVEVGITANVLAKSSQNAQVNITDKINISNSSKSLLPLMQKFLTVCESIEVNSQNTLKADIKSQFAALRNEFSELLN